MDVKAQNANWSVSYAKYSPFNRPIGRTPYLDVEAGSGSVKLTHYPEAVRHAPAPRVLRFEV